MILQSSQIPFSELRKLSLGQFREVLRQNAYSGHTAGICAGRLQANLVVLPERYAADFESFCQKNPKPCPLVARAEVGVLNFGNSDHDLDLRFDLPKYRIHQNGRFAQEVQDIFNLWQDDLVGFAIGCSFSFERALLAAGFSLRHIDEDKTVPMYRTTLETRRAGAFDGPIVVSMRPIPRERIEEVITICERFPHAHGAPLHVGSPAEIGILDLDQPDWGEVVTIHKNEVPVFWGCGVTTQLAISQAKPDIAITHAPGAMLILDVSDTGTVETKTR